MRAYRILFTGLGIALTGILCPTCGPGGVAMAQAPAAGPVQPWGLPPLPAGVGPVEKFADVSDTPQGKFLEGGSFDTQGNLWFVAIGSGWTSYLTPDGKLVPGFNCNPPAEIGQTCEPQGTRWKDGKLYLTSRHRGILVYDPQTKELKTLVYTYRNQLFKGPNDLDFDAEGNLFFTDPWGTGPGPNMSDRSGAIYQYSRDGVLRKVMDGGLFPNGIAVSPDNGTVAIGDCLGGRMWYAAFTTGPTMGIPGSTPDPLHLTFQGVKAGTYMPGNACPDGIHYDVKGNLWVAAGRLGGPILRSAAPTTSTSILRERSAELSGGSRRLIPAWSARAACACPRNRSRAPFPARRLSDREVALCTLAADLVRSKIAVIFASFLKDQGIASPNDELMPWACAVNPA
jgi:gluconolactonase